MATGFYTGKRVVVTGHASGIGAATAQALGKQGADVIGLDRTPVAGGIAVDLGDPESIDAAVTSIDGRIDALFNCAGLAPTAPTLDVIRVNFLGTRHLTQRLAACMNEAGGAIVSVSSNGGLGWRKRRAMLGDFLDREDFAQGMEWVERHESGIINGYAFAKEALTMWTLRESAYLIGRGIRINCTSPGAVETPMLRAIEARVPIAAIDATTVPIGRRSSPEEQVGALLFLNSAAASYVNGVDLPVDGGYAARWTLSG